VSSGPKGDGSNKCLEGRRLQPGLWSLVRYSDVNEDERIWKEHRNFLSVTGQSGFWVGMVGTRYYQMV